MEKEQNAILEAIDIIVKKRLRNLGFDYYVDGVITAVNISKNTYTVLINGVSYENIPAKYKLVYQLNDAVQVLIKNGNWKKKFIDGMANHTKFLTSKQYNSIDGTGVEYPLICDNGTNLWIGAYETASRHHYGRTFISAGYNDSEKIGYETVYVSVPNSTNTSGTNYKLMHNGNLIDYVYPIGSICIRETKEDPVGTLGGVWTLVDKEFTKLSVNDKTNAYFTLNTEVVSACEFRVSRAGHSLTLKAFFTLAEGVSIADATLNLGTFNYEALGIVQFPTNRSFPIGHSDGGNSIVMGYVNSDTGKLDCLDIVGADSISGTTISLQFTETITSDYMRNDACNKFYWKRKA